MMDRLTENSVDYGSVLEIKNNIIKQLKVQLDISHSSIKQLRIQNEEMSLMLAVYESGILEDQSRLEVEFTEIIKEETEKKITYLMDELNMKNNALFKAQEVIQLQQEKEEVLLKKLESLSLTKEQHSSLSVEYKRPNEMHEQKVLEDLRKVNMRRVDKTWESHKIEFELEMWIWFADCLNSSFEKGQDVRKQLEDSLLSQIEFEERLKQEKNKLVNMLKERDEIIENLKQEIISLGVPLARIDTLTVAKQDQCMLEKIKIEDLESTSEYDKEDKITQSVIYKNKKIYELIQHLELLEQKFNRSLAGLALKLQEKEAYIDLIRVTSEKIASVQNLVKLEIEEKSLMIEELEDIISNVQEKLESQEISLFDLRKHALQIEAELEAKQLEMKILTRKMEEKIKNSDVITNELKLERETLFEEILKLSSEREKLLECIGGLCERTHNFSGEEVQLTVKLGSIMQSLDNHEMGKDLENNIDKLLS